MMQRFFPRLLLPSFFVSFQVFASPPAPPPPPLVCPGGAPLGWIELTVTPPDNGVAQNIQTVNQLLVGDRISYRPVHLGALEKKSARIALLLVPSDLSRIEVYEPQPADKPVSWNVPFRTQLVSLVWGPGGLDKAKVTTLVNKDNQLIGQLADYAAKTEETQALIAAIAEEQQLGSGQTVSGAVAGITSNFPSSQPQPQSGNSRLGAALTSANPSLSGYDPLAQTTQQQATHAGGLAASVGGMFLSGGGAGIAAAGGAVLLNLHSIFFPRTQFLSALAQKDTSPDGSAADKANTTGLCGRSAPAAAHTQVAYLWALRIPDAPAPEIDLPAAQHLPIGIKSSISLDVKAGDWKLVSRVQKWRLISTATDASVPVSATVDAKTKKLDLDLTSPKLKPGRWQLAANWDWDPLPVSGDLVLHAFPTFHNAHLTPASQDKLTAGSGTLDLTLAGDDFEFVHKVEYKKLGDPFAQPQPVLFHLSKTPPSGPESSLELRLDAKPLAAGNYEFEIAQTDDKVHDTPFKVLPPPPTVSATPIILNTGAGPQTVTLHGARLDRIESATADHLRITLGDGGDGTARDIHVTLDPAAKPRDMVALQLHVKDFEEPVTIPDAFVIAGPRPEITAVRQSPQDSPGVALHPGEMPANAAVGFELAVSHAPVIAAVDLSCDGSADSPFQLKLGESKDDTKLTRKSAGTLFLLFRPDKVGQPGCSVMAKLITSGSGDSKPHQLGSIVLLPKIDSFELTNDKAGDASYFATLEGSDLENISKVGWDAVNGIAVDAIPAPVSGPGNKETLRVSMPWPAPAPHAPLYIWLRGEDQGRLTAAQY